MEDEYPKVVKIDCECCGETEDMTQYGPIDMKICDKCAAELWV